MRRSSLFLPQLHHSASRRRQGTSSRQRGGGGGIGGGRSHYPSLSLQQQQVDTSDRWRTPILPPTRSDDEADGRARWAL